MLSVSERTVRDWLSRIDKDAKEARDKRIFAMWLACRTQQEIADAEGVPQQSVADQVKGFTEIGRLAESGKAAANHATDFEPPIYNVWKQQGKTPGGKHFGNSEVRWVDPPATRGPDMRQPRPTRSRRRAGRRYSGRGAGRTGTEPHPRRGCRTSAVRRLAGGKAPMTEGPPRPG